MNDLDTLVIGAGPAGLSASHALAARGINHLVLERGNQVGHTWAHLYDSLRLHTSKRLSSLPGLSFSRTTPRFPSRADLLAYLAQYAEAFRLPIETNTDVTALARRGDSWIATCATGREYRARAVVVATGIVANPESASIPSRETFRGVVLHSAEYRRPDGFSGKRVVVVGAGNSAADIAVELAQAGAVVTIAVRSGATVVPLLVAGVPIQYLALVVNTLPSRWQRPVLTGFGKAAAFTRGAPVLPPPQRSRCRNVPVIGFRLTDAIKSGAVRLKSGVAAFTRGGVVFSDRSTQDCDVVILATGYRPALNLLGGAVRLDSCGFAERSDLVTSADQPDLYFVGHNYGIRGGLFNMRRDAALVARKIRPRRSISCRFV